MEESALEREEKSFLEIARSFLEAVSSELDPHTSKKGKIYTKADRAILETPSHIQFAKYGRGPGKKPPLDPILEWVKSEGIIFDNSTEKGTAFAIQASIGKNGTKSYTKNAPNALEEALDKYLDDFQKEYATRIAVAISNDVNSIYSKILPNRKFKI